MILRNGHEKHESSRLRGEYSKRLNAKSLLLRNPLRATYLKTRKVVIILFATVIRKSAPC